MRGDGRGESDMGGRVTLVDDYVISDAGLISETHRQTQTASNSATQ